MLLDRNTKECELAEHIATDSEVNPRMISTLKNVKSIRNMKPGTNFEISVVGPLGILVNLVRRKNRAGFFQVKDIFWETFNESFSYH